MNQSDLQVENARLRAELARSEERVRLVTEQAADALYVLNGEGRFIDVSVRATETSGYSRDELLNMYLWELEKDEHWTSESYAAFFAAQPVGTSVTAPGEHRRKDGSIYSVEARINFVEMDGEKVLMVFVRDMTDIVVAQERLRSFEALADNAQDAIVMFDPQLNVTYANPYANAMYGTDTLVDKPATNMWPEEDLPYLQTEVIPQVLAGGVSVDARQRRADGSIFEASATAFPINDAQGNLMGFGLINRDIGEQRKAAESVRQSQQLLQTFLDNIPAIIFAKDYEGRVILTNMLLCEAYGMTREEMLGKTIYDLMPDKAMADAVWLDEKRVIETREVNQGEAVVQQPDGEHIKYQSSFPLINESDEAYAVGVISMDITEQKRQEAERERLQQEVIDAQRRALQDLSTPIIPLMEGIIVIPLVGSIDSYRARDITRALLSGISQHRAKTVIMDITGVPVVDSGVADHLNKTIMAARLKGARTIVTGLSDAVAETIVDLGIDWSAVDTLRDLQTGLTYALSQRGLRLEHRS